MPKKFINPNWQQLRKLTPKLREAWFYVWDKSDACGMYTLDEAYMKADLGFVLTIAQLSTLPDVRVFSGGKIFLQKFIEVNYGKLKDGYNPHKPAFRALEQNGISDLIQACAKLEDIDEDEEEGKGEEEGKKGIGVRGKGSAPPEIPTPEMVQVFVQSEGYPLELAVRIYNYYNDANWHDSNGKQVKNWKQKIRGVWLKDENRNSNGKQTAKNNRPVPAHSATDNDFIAAFEKSRRPPSDVQNENGIGDHPF